MCKTSHNRFRQFFSFLAIAGLALSATMGPTCGVDDPIADDLRTFVDPDACQEIDSATERFTQVSLNESKVGIAPVLVLMVAWNDHPASDVTPEELDSFFFDERNPSVRNYFYNQSGGKFTIKRSSEDYPYPAVEDWISTGVDESSIWHETGDGSRSPEWYATVMNAYVDQADVDIRDYDEDGDGKVEKDELQVVIVDTLPRGNGKGGGGMRTRTIQVNLPTGDSTYPMENDFVFTGLVADTPELEERFGITMCHELDHALLGLPDRYTGGCASGYGGDYDPMSSCTGLLQLNPYDRIQLGWLEPQVLTKTDALGVFCIRAKDPIYGSLSPAIVLWDSGTYPDADQYFIIENRRNGAMPYDNTPEDGLAIWAVDENQPVKQRVTLVSWQSRGMSPRDYVESVDKTKANSGTGEGHLFRDREDIAITEDSFNLIYTSGTESRFTIYGVSPADGTSGRTLFFGLL